MRLLHLILACLIALVLSTSSPAGEAHLQWQSGFGLPGVDGQVYSLATFDDGTGESLFVGGAMMSLAGESAARGVAKWTGSCWAQLAPLERGGTVNALTAFDDGHGSRLFTGTAIGIVSAWNGSVWSELPSLRGGGSVQALAVFDDGSGAALYAAGSFGGVGSPKGSNVARWDGAKWSPVGSEKQFECIWSLVVFDDGKGPALYAAGWYYAGNEQRGGITRWNGKTWNSVGAATIGSVYALRGYDHDGPGPEAPRLYAGGAFTSAGGQPAKHMARWDETRWTQVGTGVDFDVRAIAVLDRPSGPILFAAGTNGQGKSDADPVGSVSQWDGKKWSSPQSLAPNNVLALTVFDDGHGPTLYAGGQFERVGHVVAGRVAKWTGARWEALGDGHGVDNPINALCTTDGPDRRVYAAGMFRTAGSSVVDGIAMWDGKRWLPLGAGVQDLRSAPAIRTLLIHDGSLYAGGQFATVGNVAAANIARWTGSGWTSLGKGADRAVWALSSPREGKGGSLYVGGDFSRIGGADAKCIARWDGDRWHTLGSGMSNVDQPKTQLARGGGDPHLDVEEVRPLSVRALQAFDDGHGTAIFAGGFFDRAGGNQVNSVAKWTGSAWSSLGPGVHSGKQAGRVHAMAVWNDGSSPGLYVGGEFNQAGDAPATNIARWDGLNWTPLGTGVEGAVRSLVVLDDGHGPVLYAAGGLGRIARWDGREWTSVATVPGVVSAMTVFTEGDTRGLWVGGLFSNIGDQSSKNIAFGRLVPSPLPLPRTP